MLDDPQPSKEMTNLVSTTSLAPQSAFPWLIGSALIVSVLALTGFGLNGIDDQIKYVADLRGVAINCLPRPSVEHILRLSLVGLRSFAALIALYLGPRDLLCLIWQLELS